MHFGVFDHLDRNGLSLGHQYRDRLQLIEAYDRAGFYAYHLAEHHGTPLGLASSPSVLLAAVAQRTRTLRFGPLVYPLCFYHPLRLVEEICMLDNLSGGRFELGVGKGVSPIELSFYGVGEEAVAVYEEALEIVLKGLANDRLSFQGEHFSFDDVPMEMRPIQNPHPPLWYGVAKPERAAWTAARGMNVVMNGPSHSVREIADRFREAWRATPHAKEPLPKIGMSRHIVVAASDDEARAIARSGYRHWFDSLLHLWRAHNKQIPLNFPEDPDEAMKLGLCIAGTATSVRAQLAEEIERSGINYLLCRLAFGDLTVEQSLYSVLQMQHEIMPEFASLAREVRAA
ncbi:MAG: LLM class flavin-dependent oxidoreductase [Pseudomonadota bacterium]